MAGNFWKSSHYEQWILDCADLLRERNEDLKIYTEEEYQKVMMFFVNYIQEIGRDPSVDKPNSNPQAQPSIHMQAISTACVYFRRFYARKSFKDVDPFLLAPACLMLAAKVEENAILLPNRLLSAANNVLKTKWPNIESFLAETRWSHLNLKYVDQQNIITSLIKTTQVYEAEFYILEILDCSLVFYHPYRALTQLLKDFTKKTDKLSEDPLYKDAWKICNDYCLRTDCPLLYPPHLIAIAAIMIAATKTTNISESLKTWIAELCVDFEKVFEIQQALFNMCKLWKELDEPEQLKGLLAKLPRPSPT